MSSTTNRGDKQSTTYNIINYIKGASIDDLKNLPILMKLLVEFCVDTVGEGSHGIVKKMKYGSNMNVRVKDTTVGLKTVIKMYKHFGNYSSIDYTQKIYDDEIKKYKINNTDYQKLKQIKIPKKMLILYGSYHPIYEVVGLMYLSKMWYDGISPHVPFLIMPMTCDDKQIIDSIVLDMNGLDEQITIKNRNHYEGSYEHHQSESYLENVQKFTTYILNNFTVKNNMISCKLPNVRNTIVDVVDLIDTLTLSFMISYEHVWREIKLVLTDQYANNVFLKWLHTGAYMGKRDISMVENIIYKIDGKVYGIKTNGVVLKIGDIGSSIIKPRDDLTIVIDLAGDHAVQKSMYIEQIPCYMAFIKDLYDKLPPIIAKRTILHQIINSKDFENYSLDTGVVMDSPTAGEIIHEYFSKYLSDQTIKVDEKTIIVEC
jgi:hypothetical protein